jgi:hypothetical protein
MQVYLVSCLAESGIPVALLAGNVNQTLIFVKLIPEPLAVGYRQSPKASALAIAATSDLENKDYHTEQLLAIYAPILIL